MTKLTKRLSIAGCIAVILIVSLFIFGNSTKDYLFYKNKIGSSLPNDSVVISETDSHGGFHGDGEYYSQIQLTKNGLQEFEKSIDGLDGWKKDSLPNDIQLLLSGSNLSKKLPSTINNGIYYINDRFEKQYPKQKNTNILHRAAFNFTVAILDIDTMKLYIYELDT